MEKVLRILFMEHSVPIRERMAELITERISEAAIYHADGSDDAFNKLSALQPDVVFIDSNFKVPVLSEFIASVKQELPQSEVVVLYLQITESQIEVYRRSGATGFLNKYEQFDQVADLLHQFNRNRGL